jgi:hypothetical protein
MSVYQNQYAIEKRARLRAEIALNKVSEQLKAERLSRKQKMQRLRRALLDAVAEEDSPNGFPCISFTDLRLILDRFCPNCDARAQKSEDEPQPQI